MKRRISKYTKKMEEGGLNTPWKKNRAPSYFPRERSSNANESFDHLSTNDSSRILEQRLCKYRFPVSWRWAKNRFLYSKHKGQQSFFLFFFFFRFTPFLPPLFSAPGKCDSWPATFRLCLPPLCPLPRNFQKAAQDRAAQDLILNRNGHHLIALLPFVISMRHWLTFIRFQLCEKLNDDCSARRLCTTTVVTLSRSYR